VDRTREDHQWPAPFCAPFMGLAIAFLIAACSTTALASVPPGSASSLPGTASTSSAASSLGATSSSGAVASASGPVGSGELAASALPSEAATTGPATPGAPGTSDGGWTTVLPALPIGAVYLDFGFAGNGDLLVVGTDDITKRPATVWIARYQPNGGAPKSHMTVARKMTTFFGADYTEIDPSNDTVLFTQVDFTTGYYHVYRVDSTTGKTLADLKLHAGMNAVAANATGKLFGIDATYGTYTDHRPCIVDRIGSTGAIATGIDYDLKTCETIAHFTEPFYFEDPMAIDVGNDGNLLVLDWGEAGKRIHDEPAGLGLAELTPGFDFVRRWHLPTSWQSDPTFSGIDAQGTFISGDHAGNVTFDEAAKSADRSKDVGYRLGVFDKTGALLAAYGLDGDHAGLTSPIAARFDGSDRLWVIDFDPAAKGWVIKRLDTPPWG
jgi:hypothetical protein